MQIRELSIAGAFEITPDLHPDDRGTFLEWYRHDELSRAVGHPLTLRQANLSVSIAGVVRGIHFAMVPPGQAKYFTVPAGSLIDYIVDLRVGSPTFGEWTSLNVDDLERRAVYLSEGLGHAVYVNGGGATISYLASEVFDAERELTINPLDPDIGLRFPESGPPPILSERDASAPSLAQLRARGVLPRWDDCQDLAARLRDAHV
jgi:dTDP-4-dehydrorhamnose 3,5-epimerase